VARERPPAARLALCGDAGATTGDGADDDGSSDGMVRTATAAQAASSTTAMAPSAASERHLL
jgi:hypothetical protein